MLHSLNFKHMFYFWVVAKEASVSRAAILVNVSQSSISEQIKTLESRLGMQLFDRSQKRMSLTSSGRVLFDLLNDFFPSIEELVESLANHKTSNVKFLRIGLCPTLSADLRRALCEPFLKDEQYTVKILQGENAFLQSAFERDEVDLIYTTNSNMSPYGKYEKKKLGKKKFCLVVNPSVYERLPAPHSVTALASVPYVNYTPDSNLHFKTLEFLHSRQVCPVRIAEVDDISLIRSIVSSMDCFGVLPVSAVSDDLASGRLRKVEVDNDIQCSISAIYKLKFHNENFRSNLADACPDGVF